jgi:hypothetical protein
LDRVAGRDVEKIKNKIRRQQAELRDLRAMLDAEKKAGGGVPD